MRDIISQNKELSSAGNTPKDTSPRLEKAMQDSASVPSLKNSEGNVTQGKKKIAHSATSAVKTSGRPSYEGYMNSSSAHISMNDSGYANKSIQKARYKENSTQNFVNNKDNFLSSLTNIPASGIINRHTSTNSSGIFAEGSSSRIISNMINNNNLI
jgi:hypothetical protein